MLRRAVRELVGRKGDEVAEHDLGHRLAAFERVAGRAADDRGLADRRRMHTVGEAGGQPLRDRERAAVRVEQVLAEDAYVGVVVEQVVERLVQALDHARLVGRTRPRPDGGRIVELREDVDEVGELVGLRARFRPGDGGLELAGRVPVGLLHVRRVEGRRQPGHRIARPQLGHLLGRALVVALAVRSETHRADHPEHRRLSAAHRVDERCELLLERRRVGAVERGRVDPERRCSGEHVAGDADRRGGRLRDRVVLEHDQ